jgi:hypothetical protein
MRKFCREHWVEIVSGGSFHSEHQSRPASNTGEKARSSMESFYYKKVGLVEVGCAISSGCSQLQRMLLLYSLVATAEEADDDKKSDEKESTGEEEEGLPESAITIQAKHELSTNRVPAPPPPPPLDTDRLRSATNSDGLLAVLGAAQVLKAMQDGSAKRRTEEAVLAMEE